MVFNRKDDDVPWAAPGDSHVPNRILFVPRSLRLRRLKSAPSHSPCKPFFWGFVWAKLSQKEGQQKTSWLEVHLLKIKMVDLAEGDSFAKCCQEVSRNHSFDHEEKLKYTFPNDFLSRWFLLFQRREMVISLLEPLLQRFDYWLRVWSFIQIQLRHRSWSDRWRFQNAPLPSLPWYRFPCPGSISWESTPRKPRDIQPVLFVPRPAGPAPVRRNLPSKYLEINVFHKSQDMPRPGFCCLGNLFAPYTCAHMEFWTWRKAQCPCIKPRSPILVEPQEWVRVVAQEQQERLLGCTPRSPATRCMQASQVAGGSYPQLFIIKEACGSNLLNFGFQKNHRVEAFPLQRLLPRVAPYWPARHVRGEDMVPGIQS